MRGWGVSWGVNYFASAADKVTLDENRARLLDRALSAVGEVSVVTIVTWNVPLFLAVSKIAPARLPSMLGAAEAPRPACFGGGVRRGGPAGGVGGSAGRDWRPARR